MIQARKVQFRWDALPPSWLPDHPELATVIDVLHLLLPAGERWFCHVMKQALPLVEDPQLRADLDGFIRQEGWHARSHDRLLDHLVASGIDVTPFTRDIEALFRIGDDRPFGAKLPDAAWLRFRVAVIAAIEHYTTVLGTWIIQADALAEAGADPTMLDLLRWHGAEEVEHRAVAYDTAKAIGVGYVQRQVALAFTLPIFAYVWIRGVGFLARKLPRAKRPSWRSFIRGGKQRLVPTLGYLLRATLRYPLPTYHPAKEGDTAAALAILEASPAARLAG